MGKQKLWFRGLSLMILGTLLYLPLSQAQQTQPLSLMPIPASVQPGAGSLRIDASFTVALTGQPHARMTGATERFVQQLATQTGLRIAAEPVNGSKASLVVHTDHDSKSVQEVGEDESYLL